MSNYKATKTMLRNGERAISLFDGPVLVERYFSHLDSKVNSIFDRWINGLGAVDISPAPLPIITNGAALFRYNTGTVLSRPSTDSQALSFGMNPFTIGAQVKFTNKGAGNMAICGRYLSAGNQREWLIFWNPATNFYTSAMSSSGGGANQITDGEAAPAAGVWHFVASGWDGTRAWVCLNGGTIYYSTANFSGPIFNGVADFTVGANGTGASNQMDGVICRLGIWSADLKGALLTSLAANNSKLTDDLPSALFDNILARWNMTEKRGAVRKDSVAQHLDLTSYNNVDLVAGP